MSERRVDFGRRMRFEKHQIDLMQRLREICAHFDLAEVDALTRRMTRVYFKYAKVTGLPERR